MTDTEPGERFDAFISYSRRDSAFAKVLQGRLDGFRPPKSVGLEPRPLRIFRDEGDLSGTEYFSAIDKHLKTASKLVVLCSPEAAQSQYVNDEIERFTRLHGPSGIIPVLVRGRPNNEVVPGDKDAAAFPPALVDALQLPLAIDYRDFDPRRNRPDRAPFAQSWYMLLSNLLDVSRALIEERDLKRQRRTRRITAGVVSVVIASLSGLSIVALTQRNDAIEQRGIAEEQRDIAEANERRSRGLYLGSRAREELDRGRPTEALALARAGYDVVPDQPSVRAALIAAYHRYAEAGQAAYEDLIALDESPFAAQFTSDKTAVVTGAHDSAQWLDIASGTRRVFEASRVWSVTGQSGGPIVLGTENDGTYSIDPDTGEKLRDLGDMHPSDLALSPDGRSVLGYDWDDTRAVLWPLDGSPPQTATFPGRTNMLGNVAFAPDGRSALINRKVGDVWKWEFSTGATPLLSGRNVRAAAYGPDGTIAAGTDDGLFLIEPGGNWIRYLESRPILALDFASDTGELFVMTTGEAGRFDRASDMIVASAFADQSDGLRVAPNGRYMMIVSSHHQPRNATVWDISGTDAVFSVNLTFATSAKFVEFAPDGQSVLVLSGTGLRRYFVRAPLIESQIRDGRSEEAPYLIELGDGTRLDATADAQGSRSHAYLTRPDGTEAEFPARAYITAPPKLSRSGDLLALGTKIGDVRVFDTSDATAVPTIMQSTAGMFTGQVALSEDSAFVAIASDTLDTDTEYGRSVDLFTIDAPAQPLATYEPSGRVIHLAFGPGDATLIVGTEDGQVTEYPLAPQIAQWAKDSPGFDLDENP